MKYNSTEVRNVVFPSEKLGILRAPRFTFTTIVCYRKTCIHCIALLLIRSPIPCVEIGWPAKYAARCWPQKTSRRWGLCSIYSNPFHFAEFQLAEFQFTKYQLPVGIWLGLGSVIGIGLGLKFSKMKRNHQQ